MAVYFAQIGEDGPIKIGQSQIAIEQIRLLARRHEGAACGNPTLHSDCLEARLLAPNRTWTDRI